MQDKQRPKFSGRFIYFYLCVHTGQLSCMCLEWGNRAQNMVAVCTVIQAGIETENRKIGPDVQS